MPFRHTRAIPPNLAGYFADTVTNGMGAVVDIRHPDQVAQRDPVAGRTTFTPAAPFYAGCGRVQGSSTGPDGEASSGKQQATASYLVAVPHTVVEARIGDLVRCYYGADDPALNGLWFRVVDIPKATIILQRNLRCELYEPAPRATK